MNLNNDTLLNELYQSALDAQEQALAARYAPVIRFDAREPFLPVAAGITIFRQDAPSPSMKRMVHLSPAGKPPASLAIEYAIWWDWDIHHLYELEHIWVYIGGDERVVRVEGSWHGKFHELALQREGEHPVVLSEPGKHAFADRIEPFQQRAAKLRRAETQHVGAQAHVLINEMFAGRIRSKPYDDTLVRSYLAQQAFQAAWEFSQVFRFEPQWLVGWPALHDWIPGRVNAWLEHLEATLTAEDARALRLITCDGSTAALKTALRSGADGLVLPVISGYDGTPMVGEPRSNEEPVELQRIFEFCGSVPLRALLDLRDEHVIGPLAAFLNENKIHALSPVTAYNPTWLSRMKSLAPKAHVIAQIATPQQDPLVVAASCKAAGVLPRWEKLPDALQHLTPAWIERVHAAGLLAAGWPQENAEDVRALERQRLDMVWMDLP